MKVIFAIVVLCIAAVTCQVPRPPPAARSMPVSSVQPARPQGCAPGCSPQEICAKLGRGYCRPGQSCLVCIEMSSIRFPSAALSTILGAQRPPVQPVQPVQQFQPQQQQQQQGGDFFSNMFGSGPASYLAPMMMFDFGLF